MKSVQLAQESRTSLVVPRDAMTSFARIKDEVNVRLPQCIEEVLGPVKEYNPKQVEEWCNTLGAAVLEKVQELSGNFKYIVNISGGAGKFRKFSGVVLRSMMFSQSVSACWCELLLAFLFS